MRYGVIVAAAWLAALASCAKKENNEVKPQPAAEVVNEYPKVVERTYSDTSVQRDTLTWNAQGQLLTLRNGIFRTEYTYASPGGPLTQITIWNDPVAAPRTIQVQSVPGQSLSFGNSTHFSFDAQGRISGIGVRGQGSNADSVRYVWSNGVQPDSVISRQYGRYLVLSQGDTISQRNAAGQPILFDVFAQPANRTRLNLEILLLREWKYSDLVAFIKNRTITYNELAGITQAYLVVPSQTDGRYVSNGELAYRTRTQQTLDAQGRVVQLDYTLVQGTYGLLARVVRMRFEY